MDIRAKQQIDKYEALNTYNIVLSDENSIGYEDGVSRHNKFSFQFPDIQSSHIKNAKMRVKALQLGSIANDVITQSTLRVNCNMVENTFNSFTAETFDINGNQVIEQGIGRNGNFLCFMSVNTTYYPQTITNNIPAGQIKKAAADGSAVAPDEDDVGTIVPAHTIQTNTFQHRIKPLCLPISDTFTPCKNPFGKKVDFEIAETDNFAFYGLGNAAGENTILHLEVILLPDNQANDRFNY